ncbi:MAG: hypothetical protein DRI57_18740 [Deltaproteobacteria bacterium]|nr:MAG: hypothetical protein DRI57_18740 [Deltaproteobacteria bacterium]
MPSLGDIVTRCGTVFIMTGNRPVRKKTGFHSKVAIAAVTQIRKVFLSIKKLPMIRKLSAVTGHKKK